MILYKYYWNCLTGIYKYMAKFNIKNLKIERAPKIGYTNSTRTNVHGIFTDKLERYQRALLLESPIIKNRAIDDSFIYAIFGAYVPEGRKVGTKLYWDETTNNFVNKEQLLINYNTVEWICAISGEPIRSRIDNFNLENFVHPDYHDTLSAPMVDSRILKSSVDFRKHIKKLLLDQQKEFLKHARKNSKIDL